MIKVTSVIPLDNYRIDVSFSDGLRSVVDLKPFIKGGVSEPLKDQAYFKTVKLDQFSGISWDNGFDFCPKVLWQLAMENQKQAVKV